jgi:hypothetical protein
MLQSHKPVRPSGTVLATSSKADPAAVAGDEALRARQAAAMLAEFRRGGGVVTTDELVVLLRRQHDQPLSMVARWVFRRSILSFGWRGRTLVPLFQFDRRTMLPTPELLAVVGEIRDAFDDWEAAMWFAAPNSWLAGTTPVVALCSDPASVLRAAQACRFIAFG